MDEALEGNSFVTHRKKSVSMSSSQPETPSPEENVTLDSDISELLKPSLQQTMTTSDEIQKETMQSDSELPLYPPMQSVASDLVGELSSEENMTIPVAMFQKFATNVESQFSHLRQELYSLKAMQTQIDEVNDLANDAIVASQTNTDDIESLNEKVQSLEEQLQQTEIEVSETKQELNKINLELKSVKDVSSTFDDYRRRDNLLFINVPFEVNENCEKKVRDILASLDIEDATSIKFVKCYRLKMDKAPPPIMCQFCYFGDRQRVFEKRKELKGSNTFVEEHFSENTYKLRKALMPIQLAARKQGLKSFLKLDKVMIEGKLYAVDDLGDLPDSLKYLATCSKQNDDATVFFGERSPLSNFFKTSFTDGETHYHSTEMYLQHHKALLFKDEATAYKIRSSKSPAHAKALSYRIKDVNQAVWEQKAPLIMKKGLELKFNTNSHCKMSLLETGTRFLGEATSSDKFWGTGVALYDSLALNHGGWTGQNNMGKLLEELREQLSF